MKKTVARPLGASLITAGLAVVLAGLFSTSASADTGTSPVPTPSATPAAATTGATPAAAAPSAPPSAQPTTVPTAAAPKAAVATAAVAKAAGAKAAVTPDSVINGAITGVTITQKAAGQHQAMQVNLTWAVPATATPGDSFSLTLPPQLVANTSSFDLLAPDGSVVATCRVVGGVATFTLTDYVATHHDVSGTAFFSVGWATSESTVTGPVHLVFTAGTKPFPVTVTHNGPGSGGTTPQKSGNWVDKNHQGGPDSISWHVFTPVGPFTTAKLTDASGPGQAIDCSTLKFRLGSGVDSTGKPTSVTALPSKDLSGLTCSATGISATVGPVGAGQDVQITYLSSVLAASDGTYPNSVTMTVDGTTFKTVTATVRREGAGGNGQGSTPTTSPTTKTTPTTPTPTPTVKPRALTGNGGTLPFTGADIAPLLALAGLLLAGGLALLLGSAPRGARRH